MLVKVGKSRSHLKPYFEGNGIQLYLGDCLDIVPRLPTHLHEDIGCIFTDPPYGIGFEQGFHSGRAPRNYYHPIKGDSEPFNPWWILQYNLPTVLWGANHFCSKLPDASGWLVWDKNRPQSADQAQGELAWTNYILGVRILKHTWNGFMRATEKRTSYHPNQKPVSLWYWVLNLRTFSRVLRRNPHWRLHTSTILDPYCGSGPLLIAAYASGRKAIGIEISKYYADIAVKRLKNAFNTPIPLLMQ